MTEFTRRTVGKLSLGALIAATSPGSARLGTKAGPVLGGLEDHVEAVRKRFGAPGIAIAVFKDGEIAFKRGFGRRDPAGHGRVDTDTLFCLASNTKPFTATCLAILEDANLLRPDDRIVDHLPGFRMSNAMVTRELRVSDILAHRSGLGAHAGDLLFYPPTTYSLAEVVERIGNVPLAYPFRQQFAYENLQYAVAAQLIETVSGQSYAEFVQRRIFGPLGMTRSRIDGDGLGEVDNVATGFRRLEDGLLHPVPPLVWHNNPGAGGIYSSADDMISWMQVHLARGRLPDGGRLFSRQAQDRMWLPHVPIPTGTARTPALAAAQPSRFAYGAGWFLSDYRGQRLIWHTGEFPGFASQMTLLPEQDLGILVLTNQEDDEVFEAITYHLLDIYLGAPKTDWLAAFAAAHEQDRIAAMPVPEVAGAKQNGKPAPSLPLDDYAGTFEDRWYGAVEIVLSAGGLTIRFTRTPGFEGRLEHSNGDSFLVRWHDRLLLADALISFEIGNDHRVARATMRRVSPLTAPSFDFQDLDLIRQPR